MKLFSSRTLLAAGLFIGLFSFNACQKDSFNPANPVSVPNMPEAGNRAPITYGVTVYDPTHPSQIIGMDGAGNILTTASAFYIDPSGNTVNFDNLKGICMTSAGQYFITTGAPASTVLGASIYDNSLMKVNPVTGQCSYFNSVCPFGTVSDLEFVPATQDFVGLLNNTNQLVTITLDAFGNYTVYNGPFAVTGIAGRMLSGLSIVRDNTGTYLVGAATRPGNTALAAQLYNVPFGGGLATLMTDLAPLTDFAGGNAGIGFDRQINHLAVNRTNAVVTVPLGLSEINPWAVPLGAITGTAYWGLQSLNFEDLTSNP